MHLCVRVDLDYVPWDTPDALEFGHGEPAIVLRLLDLATATGAKYHFFASNRVLRAFPSTADTVLNDGHDLDWLCKHPEELVGRYGEADELFEAVGHKAEGLALRAAWPGDLLEMPVPPGLRFVSATPGAVPAGLRLYPVETRPERDALRAGQSIRAWVDGIKTHMRHVASVNRGATIVIRPQVLAKIDPHLRYVRELVEFALALEFRIRTLRDLERENPAP